MTTESNVSAVLELACRELVTRFSYQVQLAPGTGLGHARALLIDMTSRGQRLGNDDINVVRHTAWIPATDSITHKLVMHAFRELLIETGQFALLTKSQKSEVDHLTSYKHPVPY